jgi:hypothetical protein
MSNWNFQHFDTQSEIGIVDENGVTHRVRKKPGRKANPAASAQRKVCEGQDMSQFLYFSNLFYLGSKSSSSKSI